TTSSDFTVTENATPTVSITGTMEVCAGNTIELTALGTGDFTWSTGATSTSIFVGGGTYSVLLEDANGCTTTSSDFTVTENATPTVSVTGLTEVCAGDMVQLTAIGATNYVWSNGATTETIMVAAGAYSVIGTDGSGCLAISSTLTVTENLPPTVTISGSTSVCPGDMAQLTASGGTNYIWSNGATSSTTLVNAGEYSVMGTDINGCVASSASFTVSVNNAIPEVSLSLLPAQKTHEDADNITFIFVFTRTEVGCMSDLPVNFSVGGTAVYNDDYYHVRGADNFTITNGSITIPAGQTSVELVLEIQQDAIYETDETIIIMITP
ncbi:MAG: hypothetical protein AAF740_04210, partial [Bacteroidota bacterium]